MKVHELLKQINDAWNEKPEVLDYNVWMHTDYDRSLEPAYQTDIDHTYKRIYVEG